MNSERFYDFEEEPIRFGATFVGSDAFRDLFREGMLLVEETAAFLDGPGRAESRGLPRRASLTYASESMRLTTRLMQIASWLLVQRAVAEREITADQALQEKNRVRLSTHQPGASDESLEPLPETLKGLIEASIRLHARILHLDRLVSDERPSASRRDSPVAAQLSLIRSAFAAAG